MHSVVATIEHLSKHTISPSYSIKTLTISAQAESIAPLPSTTARRANDVVCPMTLLAQATVLTTY